MTVPEFLTTREVAALFRVEPTTIRRWAKTGRLESGVTPGGRPRYPAAAVAAARGVTVEQLGDQVAALRQAPPP